MISSRVWRIPPAIPDTMSSLLPRLILADEMGSVEPWADAPSADAAASGQRRKLSFHDPPTNLLCRGVLAAMRAELRGEEPLVSDIASHTAFLQKFGTLPDAEPAEHITVTGEAYDAAAARSRALMERCLQVAERFADPVHEALRDAPSHDHRSTLLAALGLPEDPNRIAAHEWAAIGRGLSHLLASSHVRDEAQPGGCAWPFDRPAPPVWVRLVRRQRRHLGCMGVSPHRARSVPDMPRDPSASWPRAQASDDASDAGDVSRPRSNDRHALRRLNRHLRNAPRDDESQQTSLFNSRSLQANQIADRARGLYERVSVGGGYRHTFVRRASGKVRRLDVPDADLAGLQRTFAQWLARSLVLPAEITGFVPRRSVVTHARRHAGAVAAAIVDIADFFGSVRPVQVRAALALETGAFASSYDALGPQVQEHLLHACFRWPENAPPYLPQGAPSSPMLANLAARRLDGRIVQAAIEAFGKGNFTYSRYADDLALSTTAAIPDFGARARALLESAVRSVGWSPARGKSRTWRAGGAPLLLCGVSLPSSPTGALRLPRVTMREVRALVHRIRLGDLDVCGEAHSTESAMRARGTLAWVYAVTGDPAWYAFGSRHVRALARDLGADPAHLRAFCTGWLDGARSTT